MRWAGLALALAACDPTAPPGDGSMAAGGAGTGGAAVGSGGGTGAGGGSDSGGAAIGGAGGAPTSSSGGNTSGGGAGGTSSSGGQGSGSGGLDGSSGGSGGGGSSGGSPGSGGTLATFQNPLNESHGSDPWMLYYEGQYYLAATTWGDTLTMKHGATIAELKAADTEIIWQDPTASRCCNMWAPEFYLLDGGSGLRWYHYYTAGDGDDLGTQRLHVLESAGTDPMGPYSYKGQLLDYWAIDSSLLEVDGDYYLMFSAWDGPTQNTWIIAMDNPWTVSGNRTLLTAPTYAWEQEGSDSVNEGPAALYEGGRTFVTYSASQCADPGYKLGLLEFVGTDPLDEADWTKSATPVFSATNGAYGPGHNGFFRSPDGTEQWLVYHATTNSSGSCWTDRTTRIQKIEWNQDGTPSFGEPFATSTTLTVPPGE